MKILREKQYAAFAANAKMLDSLRRNEVNYVPGVFEVAKVIILSKEDFEKLSEDVSPEYPFLKDNREIMSADPGGLFRCLMVRAEGEKENMLIAQRHDTLYLGYGRDYRSVDLQGVPVERIALEEPKAYQEKAVFYYRPKYNDKPDLEHSEPEQQTNFLVEQIVVLADQQYRRFRESGLWTNQSYLSLYRDKMWFDPQKLCWHCVLVKGENSRNGILAETEGHDYVRYSAYIPDCEKLRLKDVPVYYEWPQGKIREERAREEKNRAEHFSSFVGLMLSSPATELHFLEYDTDTGLFMIRHQGGPEMYIDRKFLPEDLAESFHFSGELLENFLNMDYRNQTHNSEYFRPSKQKETRKRKEPER